MFCVGGKGCEGEGNIEREEWELQHRPTHSHPQSSDDKPDENLPERGQTERDGLVGGRLQVAAGGAKGAGDDDGGGEGLQGKEEEDERAKQPGGRGPAEEPDGPEGRRTAVRSSRWWCSLLCRSGERRIVRDKEGRPEGKERRRTYDNLGRKTRGSCWFGRIHEDGDDVCERERRAFVRSESSKMASDEGDEQLTS